MLPNPASPEILTVSIDPLSIARIKLRFLTEHSGVSDSLRLNRATS
jgi:hypothetical protein